MKRLEVVVADTTPMNYLIIIGRVEILASLFLEVLTPQAVIDADGIAALNDLRSTTFRADPELVGRFEARMKARR